MVDSHPDRNGIELCLLDLLPANLYHTNSARLQPGLFSGTVTVPQWVLDQLVARNRSFPVNWRDEEKYVPWLVPGRLLLTFDTGKWRAW